MQIRPYVHRQETFPAAAGTGIDVLLDSRAWKILNKTYSYALKG